MAKRKVGVWLIGAWGGVATTVVVGLAALRKGLTDTTGLVTSLPPFAGLDLMNWDEVVVGGHEIRETTYLAEARVLIEKSHVFNEKTLTAISSQLAKFDANVRPGTLVNVGAKIESLAGPAALKTRNETAGQAVSRLAKDLTKFKADHKLDRVIVVNVSSTEPPPPDEVRSWKWVDIQKSLASKSHSPIPASTLYALAAMQSGSHFVNFTPSIGSDLPGLDEYARQQQVLHAGRDGKTGETLMKAVLAPMFAARNLKVMSWVGHNIFGNLDGKVLEDPANKANKVKSKDHLLTEILGYKPQTLVSIEYIESMGDWKTAWDHIHFQGFLGTPMVLQFTWQGCDSLLAAPLVIDLIRLTEREARRGKIGLMSHLGSFFKSPMGTDEPAFAYQFQELMQWVHSVTNESQTPKDA
ncbi:MAG: myo-inositol-1-phosphate synthase [Planctomycetota bacterium]|jgi:myo-inositol-1-phosphate synthase|nr:MAG: myo-inositol-1-phosphate synthase [Planctomycetota bacterium]